MKYWLLYGILLQMNFFSFAQKTLSYEQACADIDYYYAKIDSIHPNMYWHTTKARVDSFKMTLKDRCRDSIAVGEFSFLLSQGNHFFDSHTGHYDFWNEFYLKSCDTVYPQSPVFPQVIFRSDGVYLKEKDWRILSINGYPIDAIVKIVKNQFGADLPDEAIYAKMNLSLLFQHSLMFLGIYSPCEVKVEPDEGDTTVYIEKGVDYWALKYEVNEFGDEFWGYDDNYIFRSYPDSSVAVIYLYSSRIEDKEMVAFDQFLKSCFQELESEKIENLFIDISRNQGGNSSAHGLFFKYLQNKKSFRSAFRAQDKVLIGKNKFRTKLIRHMERLPRQEGYDGKVFIYQSPLSHSAAPKLSYLFRMLDRGILVGTSTERIDYIYSRLAYIDLPNSHLRAASASRYFLPWSRPPEMNAEGGLDPDIPYPFLFEHPLELSDCMKIIELDKQRKIK